MQTADNLKLKNKIFFYKMFKKSLVDTWEVEEMKEE